MNHDDDSDDSGYGLGPRSDFFFFTLLPLLVFLVAMGVIALEVLKWIF